MLTLVRPAFEALRRHAEQRYPEECCGLLLGAHAPTLRRATQVRPLRNVAAVPRIRYQLDPAEHLAAQRSARIEGLEIIGYFHSHPDHPAEPSATDLDLATWPGYSYVIASVQQGRAAVVRAFELAADRSRFIEETMEIIA